MPLRLEAGQRPIPGYTLIRRLGKGAFGEAWEASAPGGVHVALKFIALDTLEAGTEQRALEVIRNIRHPHLLDVQFAARVEDFLLIAMPLCDATLLDRLRACQQAGHQGLPRDELLGYMEELARAVDFLNEPRHRLGESGPVGVQHRDIKPGNVFLVGDSVRLADFGLAKVLEASMASHTGSMTPHYVAPEVVARRVSQWSDQYSLAATYFHLRSGRHVFSGESVYQILFAHVNDPPDLSVLPEPERQVVARALAKQPTERWPTCRDFVRALAASARGPDGLAGPATGSPRVGVEETGGGSATGGTTETLFPTALGLTQVPLTMIGAGDQDGGSHRARGRGIARYVVAAIVGCGYIAGSVWLVRNEGENYRRAHPRQTAAPTGTDFRPPGPMIGDTRPLNPAEGGRPPRRPGR
jgi:serine/threonine protein kinase